MCRRVNCPNCNKPDWRGCGAHVEAVLGDVPKDDRCKCKPSEKAGPAGGGIFSWFSNR